MRLLKSAARRLIVPMDTNVYGQPIGHRVPDWTSRSHPPSTPMVGAHVVVERLDPKHHADGLFDAYRLDPGSMWTYLPYGPFDRSEFDTWLDSWSGSLDPMFHAIVDAASDRALGLASFLRINSAIGSIEVGHISYSPLLARTAGATEAMWLMMRRVFGELGYRRYEWKCDALNAASRAAAARLGFIYEGTFRNHTIYKERNRDSAWFAVTDTDWPLLDTAFRAWLDPANLEGGIQRRSLSQIRSDLTAA